MEIVGERNTTRSLFRPSTRCVVARVVRSNSRSRLTTMVNVDRDTTTNARLRVHRALKESRPHVFFCRPPRFNWMSLLRCRALLSVPGPPFIGVYPPLFHSPDPDPAAWSAEPASPLLSSPLLSSPPLPPLLSLPRVSSRFPRSLTRRDLRSYIYCIEETRAAAFLAHAPPVMSGLQSPVCLSVRLSRGPVARSPSIPLTRPFSRDISLHAPQPFSFFSARHRCAASARYSSLPRSLAIPSRHCRPGHSSIYANQIAPSSRNSFFLNSPDRDSR